jgi:hypothetical protein
VLVAHGPTTMRDGPGITGSERSRRRPPVPTPPSRAELQRQAAEVAHAAEGRVVRLVLVGRVNARARDDRQVIAIDHRSRVHEGVRQLRRMRDRAGGKPVQAVESVREHKRRSLAVARERPVSDASTTLQAPAVSLQSRPARTVSAVRNRTQQNFWIAYRIPPPTFHPVSGAARVHILASRSLCQGVRTWLRPAILLAGAPTSFERTVSHFLFSAA